MRVTVEIDGRQVEARKPQAGEAHVEVSKPCPGCGKAPLLVRGTGILGHDHDTYQTAASEALCCGALLGPMRCRVDTIFGIDEDRAVLFGRPRVY